MNKLTQISFCLPLIQSIFPDDVKLVLFDTEKIIADLPGQFIKTPSKVGTLWSDFKGTVSYKAYEERRIVREERGPEAFGVAYIAISAPIYEENEFVGVISALVSNHRLNTMKIGSEMLSTAVASLSGTTASLNEASEDLTSQVHHLFMQSEQIIQAVANSQSTLTKVQEIAEQSKLMGLNAAIEAARLGDLGRGFDVIATEIRKMANYSNDLSVDIRKKMKEIEKSVHEMHQSIQQIAAFSQQQSASMSEMNRAFEQILATSNELLANSRL